MFRLNPERTGTFETQAISSVGQVKWQFRAGAGFRSSPALVEELLFIGCLDGNLYAVDVSFGKERWISVRCGAQQWQAGLEFYHPG